MDAAHAHPACAAQIYEQRDWLLGPYAVPQEYDETGIRAVLDSMTPDNLRALWSAKKFEGNTESAEPCDEREPRPSPSALRCPDFRALQFRPRA